MEKYKLVSFSQRGKKKKPTVVYFISWNSYLWVSIGSYSCSSLGVTCSLLQFFYKVIQEKLFNLIILLMC